MDKPKPPHGGKRLTRDDVERLIEEHGGPEGLDLRQADLQQADLSELQLHRADLLGANLQGATLHHANLHGARLWYTNLQEAHLWHTNLQEANVLAANLERANLQAANLQGADLAGANLQGADLAGANLGGANLEHANLQGAALQIANLQGACLDRADLRRARLQRANLRDANLEDSNWGDYVLGEEIERDFDEAASVYRALKQRHTEAGMYDVAGQFHYREMEAGRKLAWKERRLPYALSMYLLRFLYGYGERPLRVIGWAAAVVFGLALVHWLFGTVAGGFLDALYYSAVSFPALGYGEWAPEPQGWAGRFLGAGESFIGVFMMALFLVTFTRKMTR
jgi:hypothetical protein